MPKSVKELFLHNKQQDNVMPILFYNDSENGL